MYCSVFQVSPLSEKHWDLDFVDMCVCTHAYICMSLVSILASWYRFVLACFGGRTGCVKLGIFQGSTSLGF